MKNKYILAIPLLILLSLSTFFLISKPVINNSLDPAECNCSGPKASKSKLSNN